MGLLPGVSRPCRGCVQLIGDRRNPLPVAVSHGETLEIDRRQPLGVQSRTVEFGGGTWAFLDVSDRLGASGLGLSEDGEADWDGGEPRRRSEIDDSRWILFLFRWVCLSLEDLIKIQK